MLIYSPSAAGCSLGGQPFPNCRPGQASHACFAVRTTAVHSGSAFMLDAPAGLPFPLGELTMPAITRSIIEAA